MSKYIINEIKITKKKGFYIMREYIEAKIAKMQEISNPEVYLSLLAHSDTEIRELWKEERKKDNACWRNIRTNKDVIDLIERFDGRVCFVEKNIPYGSGHIEDGYNMALAQYRAIQGLRKMAQFIDPSPFSQTEFVLLSETEIDKLFDRMNDIVKRMNEQNMRRAMQD